MAGKEKNRPLLMRFPCAPQADVLRTKNSKYKQIISQLLHDLELLDYGEALRVPLSELPDRRENVRSALNRAAVQRGMHVTTSGDRDYLYVWKLSTNTNEVNTVAPAPFPMTKAVAEVASIADSPKMASRTWTQPPRNQISTVGAMSTVFNKTAPETLTNAGFASDGKKKSCSEKGGQVLEELA
jgi:hypothetical protein